MSKGAKIIAAVVVIAGILAAAGVLCEIFSTKMNKYYKVDCK